MKVAFCLLCIVFSGLTSRLHANQLVDGGFDITAPPGNTFAFLANETPTGWSWIGSSDDTWEGSGRVALSHAGQGYIAFGGNSTTGGVLYQDFSVTTNTDYLLSFYYALIQGSGQEQSFIASINKTPGNGGAIIDFLDVEVPVEFNEIGVYMLATLQFNSGSETALRVSFQDTTIGGGGVNWALDTVSVVPEPTSTALGILGLATLFGRRRLK